MRLIIETEIKFDEIDEEQSKTLEDFSISFSKSDNLLIINPQKIDLEQNDIEDFLDILYFNFLDNSKINLYRYERDRYVLNIN